MADTDAIIDAAFAADNAAQPQADANTTETKTGTQETVPETPEDPWPKKAQNALSEQKGKTAKWRNTAKQYEAEIARLTAQSVKTPAAGQSPSQGNLSPAKTGIPTKLDPNKFSNWAEYSEARSEEIADYKIEQKLSERDKKQTESQATADEKTWETERSKIVDKQGEEFAKEHPEIIQIFNDNAQLIQSFPKEIKHALLAADNAPLALLNLAKEGKLEDLGDMSLVDAKVEIRLAQMKPAEKPKSKAPAPLSASRGSVAGSKSPDDMNGDEIRAWMKSE